MGTDPIFKKMGSVPIFILAAHILSMLGFSTYAALLPELRDEWSLSNAQAGIVGGMFFAGYVATVSLWTALTDRMDARRARAPSPAARRRRRAIAARARRR